MRIPPRALLVTVCCALLAGCAPFTGGGAADGPFPTISPRPGISGTSWRNFAFGTPEAWEGTSGSGASSSWTWRDPGGDIVMTAFANGIVDCPAPGRVGTLPRPGHRESGTGGMVTGVRRIHVPGAGGALRFTVSGAKLGDKVQLHVWTPGCRDELILDVYDTAAADDIADTIVVQRG